MPSTPLRPDISFFVIGAARCGTTSLHRHLVRHPQIAVPAKKEPRFFSKNFDKGWDWFADIYRDKQPDQIAGDFSPGYSNMVTKNRALRRIAQYYPDAKIIYMVRNPIDCALSNWRMASNLGAAPSFAECVGTHKTVFHRTLFWKQISAYREEFPDDRILVMPLEKMSAESEKQTRVITDYLGISPFHEDYPHRNVSDRKSNRAPKPAVDVDTRKRFIDLVREDSEQILRYAGHEGLWDLSVDYKGWKVD